MTSYPKRITNVGKAIYALLTKQTRKPDEIHLWLAEPEFPNREKDLPPDLQVILEIDNVFLHWLPKNTYVHKRHEIFKYTKNEDLVYIFDEDVRYDDRLIETVYNDHKKYPDCIINFNTYPEHIYKGYRILYNSGGKIKEPSIYTRFFGQSMIPSKIFPKELLTDENENIRDEICPICDESWLTPWFVYYDIKIYCERFGWGKNLTKDVNMWDGLVKYTHQKEANGLERRDNWLLNVLNTFPQIKEKYEKLFNYGK